MQSGTSKTCVQCGSEVLTAFCPVCGQRSDVKRLTLRDTVEDLWSNLAGLDGLFLRTLKELTRRPGLVALSYIRGVRTRYFGPIAYFFLMITLLLLWVSILGMDFAELIRDRQQDITGSSPTQPGAAVITKLFSDNIKWVLFLAVPFQALVARHILFRKSGYNLIEQMVPLFYISGHLFWLTMLMFLIKKVAGELYSAPAMIFSLAYFGFVYQDLMRYQSRLKAFVKGCLVYLGGQILFVVVLVIVIVISVVVLALINPDALEAFRPTNQ